MAHDFAILRADLQQVDTIAPLFDAYRHFYRQAPDLEHAREFIKDRLARSESVIFLAVREGIGLGFAQLYPSFSSVEMKRLWILNDLFVTPSARKRGVGRVLLERARQFALETGATALMLETAVDNLTAQRLYEQLGWKREVEFYTYYLYV